LVLFFRKVFSAAGRMRPERPRVALLPSSMNDAPPKRALLFAPYFLPRRRVGSMRPFRFAIHLREFGWQPTVLTIAAEGQELTEKEARLLSGVEIVRLRPPFDRSTSAESQLGLASEQAEGDGRGSLGTRGIQQPGSGAASSSRETTSDRPLLQRLLKRALDGFDRQFPVDTWLLFFLLKYRRIARVVRRVRPHVLWSTGDPWSGLVVGAHLRRRFGIPWVADFRDPWTLSSVRPQEKSRLTRATNRFFERRVLKAADAAVFAAEATEAKYRAHYADLSPRTTTIYNSYDPTVFDDPGAGGASVAPASSAERLDVGFFGRFRELSPATPLIDALSAVRRTHGAAVAASIRVHSFGPLSAADAHRAERRGVRDSFRRRNAVPLEQALSALRRFDLLLVSTHPCRDDIVPAKLWEYLAAGRPVLSLSKNPEVERILERTGTGVQFDPEAPDTVAGLLAESLSNKRAGQPLQLPFDPRPEAIQAFSARATTEQLADLFSSVAAPSSVSPDSPDE